MRWLLRTACLALGCGMLVGCGLGQPRLAPTAEPSPQGMTSSTAGALATPVGAALESRIGDIVWATGTDPATNAPVAPVSGYRPDAPRIVATLRIDGLNAGSVVEATWEYNDTSLDAFTTRLTLADAAGQWLSFHIARDPEVLWPVGRYAVTISLDGTAIQRAAIDVSEQS